MLIFLLAFLITISPGAKNVLISLFLAVVGILIDVARSGNQVTLPGLAIALAIGLINWLTTHEALLSGQAAPTIVAPQADTAVIVTSPEKNNEPPAT